MLYIKYIIISYIYNLNLNVKSPTMRLYCVSNFFVNENGDTHLYDLAILYNSKFL